MKYFILLSFVTLFACGDSADAARVEAISALTGDVTAGATVYNAECNRCHVEGGAGSALGPNIQNVSKEETIEIMLTGDGSMPPFDGLEDQELADCAAYVLTF